MKLIGISLLLGLCTILLLHSLIVTLSTSEDWSYRRWIKEFKEMFEMKVFFIIGILLFSLLFYGVMKVSTLKVETVPSSSRKGECTCNCNQDRCRLCGSHLICPPHIEGEQKVPNDSGRD